MEIREIEAHHNLTNNQSAEQVIHNHKGDSRVAGVD